MIITVNVKVTAQWLPKMPRSLLTHASNKRIPRMWTKNGVFLLTSSRVSAVFSSAIWLGNHVICKEKNMGRPNDFQICA